jgi:integrase
MRQAHLPGFEPQNVQHPDETTTKQRSTVGTGTQIAKIDSQPSAPIQPALEGLGVAPLSSPGKRTCRRMPPPTGVEMFQKRLLARVAERSAGQYRWMMRDILRLAERIAGRLLSVEELLCDEDTLGKVLSSPLNGAGDKTISAWRASQRRSVLRSFIDLMSPELRTAGVEDASARLTSALRRAAVPVGGGYRLPVGIPRGRGGPAPEPREVAAIGAALSERAGWRSSRNQLLFGLLALRGQRINGLLRIHGDQVHKTPGGRYRVILHIKSAREPFELAVPADLAELLEAYVMGFNRWAATIGTSETIGPGQQSAFWRGDRGGTLTYQAWTQELKSACLSAGVPVYTSHALRRAFATQGVAIALRRTVAVAGGWTSTRRMDDHYTQTSMSRVKQFLKSAAGTGPQREPRHNEASVVGVTRRAGDTGDIIKPRHNEALVVGATP